MADDAVDVYQVLHEAFDAIQCDPDFASDLACDLLDRKSEDMFVRAVYHKIRRLGVPVERERKRIDLIIGGQAIEAKVFSPWTVMRESDGRKDRSFDDFLHSKDHTALVDGTADWLMAIIPHPLDRPHRQYPTRSHPGIVDYETFLGSMGGVAAVWAERNGVHLAHRFPLELRDTAPGSDTGRIAVLVFLFSARVPS